jgi:cytochrome c oxidase subunit 1
MATADAVIHASEPRGIAAWLTTVDHKRIGILYFVSALAFFVLAGVQALVIRAQLAQPNGSIVSPEQYNQLFTMHGLSMIFFAVMPMGAAFFNYLLPIMIGARDVAFPRLNAFSYWVFLAAGIFLYSSVFLGGTPDCAWTCYSPISTIGGDPLGQTIGGTGVGTNLLANGESLRPLFYSLGLQMAGIASLASAVNFIVTILNMRAPGMTLMRMPVFVWMMLVVSFLMLFAMPVIGVALWQLLMDGGFNGRFFDPSVGGDPVLWQHLFWVFGHPEVYILILPAFGIVSEILPTFTRKPLFGYTAIVFSGIAIGFMGWGVWAHHMFTVGLGPVANAAFGLSTMFIAVPTGIKIFNWLGTLWGGQIRFTSAMLFAVAVIGMFTIGGLSGVTHSIVPHDTQQHDTYYVVAHFHYVIFGGAVFGLMAGAYYWYPKAVGRKMNEGLGKLHFALQMIGFNLTFGPMHLLGLNGMPRRIQRYDPDYGWNFWNAVSSVGAVIIAVGVAVFIFNLAVSRKRGEKVEHDPWDARTIEWLTTSPPPVHNFDIIPSVRARDELWHRKYSGTAEREPVKVPAGGSDENTAEDVIDPGITAASEGTTGGSPSSGTHTLASAGYDAGVGGAGIHMPSPSYYPAVAAAGLPLAGWGLMFGGPGRFLLLGLGAVFTIGGMFGWVLEPSAEPTPSDPTHPEHH